MFNPKDSPRGPLPNDGRPIFLPGLGQGLRRKQPRSEVTFAEEAEVIEAPDATWNQRPPSDTESSTSSHSQQADFPSDTAPAVVVTSADEDHSSEQRSISQGSETSRSSRFSEMAEESEPVQTSSPAKSPKKKGIFGFGAKKQRTPRGRSSASGEDGDQASMDYLDVENGQSRRRRSSLLSSGRRSPRSSASAMSKLSSRSRSSYYSEDEFEYTKFMENLDPETQEALDDGEDFDYFGLFAHPTHDLDEDVLKENIVIQKEIVGRIKEQPWRMRRKLKLHRIAQFYIERYEGRLSKGRANVANVTRVFKQIRRVLGNFIATLMPWEERIKGIENRFGSAAASFFLLLRWIIWVNFIQTALIVSFVMVPESLTGKEPGTDWRKTITEDEKPTALNLDVVMKYGGYIRYTPIYYGWYGDTPVFPNGYRLPLAYFVTTICIFVHSFWVVLAKMAANVKQSSSVSNTDQFQYTLRTYTSWDFMIANRDTADNKVAAVSRSYKELLVDEGHKGEEMNKWLRLFLRILAWVITAGFLGLALYILFLAMDWKKNFKRPDPSYFESNVVSLTLKAISLVFPEFFDKLELLEHYHPLVSLKLHLSRIAMLALVTNYAFISNWISEAREAIEETATVKDQFGWIWNSSFPQPTNWQSVIAIPRELDHGDPSHGEELAYHHDSSHTGLDGLDHTRATGLSDGRSPEGALRIVEPDFSLGDGDFDFDTFLSSWKTTRTTTTTTETSTSTYGTTLLLSNSSEYVDSSPFANDSTTVMETEAPSTEPTTPENTWPTVKLRPRSSTTLKPPEPVTHPPVSVQRLKALCWENKVALEGLENLITETITSVAETLVTEFIRGLFVRFLAKCWFWDLETVPGYPNFRVSENVISLITGQQMAWIGFFFAPALIPINLFRLVFQMYFRSWVTQVCNVPPETMFNTGQGNNFYFYILLLMLFVSTLFIGYTVCFLQPSWSCGPFSQYEKIYYVLTETVGENLPSAASSYVDYLTSPAIVIPFLMLLLIVIFYLFTVRMALTKQTKTLKRTLEIERTEEKRKIKNQIEAKRKKEQLALQGTVGRDDDEAEIPIEEAKANAESLLDKMMNRGFPPDEMAEPTVPSSKMQPSPGDFMMEKPMRPIPAIVETHDETGAFPVLGLMKIRSKFLAKARQ